jgi:phage tail protein X
MNRYENIPVIKNDKNQQVYKTATLPDAVPSIDDIYVMTTPGDRLDLLAYQYYGNQSYWWIIANANPDVKKGTMALDGGIQLRIPTNPQDIITDFRNLNK